LISQSSLERRTASKYFIFLFFNVFLGSVITGSAMEQLKTYLHQSANEYVPHRHIYQLYTSRNIINFCVIAHRLCPTVIYHASYFYLPCISKFVLHILISNGPAQTHVPIIH
jgi:hypothetical protein